MKILIISFVIVLLLSMDIYSQETLLTPEEDEVQKITAIGNVISKKLLGNLQAELLKEMKNGNPVSAIELCNIKALPLTNELLEPDHNIIEIKRITEKYRNPLNKPDSIELKVLNYFAHKWNKESETFVQKLENKNGVYYKYYKSLGVKGICLSCHGNENNIDKEVKKKLMELYPDDKATGYNVGDFRGAISITIGDK